MEHRNSTNSSEVIKLFQYYMKEDAVLNCNIKVQICITSHSSQLRFLLKLCLFANAREKQSVFNTGREKHSIDF